MTAKQVMFTKQVSLPAIGQGTWYMGEDPADAGKRFQRCGLVWISVCG